MWSSMLNRLSRKPDLRPQLHRGQTRFFEHRTSNVQHRTSNDWISLRPDRLVAPALLYTSSPTSPQGAQPLRGCVQCSIRNSGICIHLRKSADENIRNISFVLFVSSCSKNKPVSQNISICVHLCSSADDFHQALPHHSPAE